MKVSHQTLAVTALLSLLVMPCALHAQNVCQGGTVPYACVPDASAYEVVAVSEIETGYYPTIASYSATELGAALQPYYNAYVLAALYQSNVYVSESGYSNPGIAAFSMGTPWLANQTYQVVSYHYIFSVLTGFGLYYSPYVFSGGGGPASWVFFASGNPNPWTPLPYLYLGYTTWSFSTSVPAITSITPANGANSLPSNMGTAIPQGSYACVYINGSNLTAGGADPTPTAVDATPNPNGTFVPFLWPGVNLLNSDTQLEVCYTAPNNATMGEHYLQVTTDVGSSALYQGGPGSSDGLYCEHGMPSTLGISPSVWYVSTGSSTTISLNVYGFAFTETGTSFTVSGPGVTNWSSEGCASDLCGFVTIDASSHGGNAQVVVYFQAQMQGDGFMQAPGQVTISPPPQIVPVHPPTPTIVLGQGVTACTNGTNIAAGNQQPSFLVGQRVAFTACFPAGYQISSESWTGPGNMGDSAVGGFAVTQTAAGNQRTGTGGAVSLPPNPSCAQAQNCDYPPFYWVDPQVRPQAVFQCAYTLSNGLSASASTTLSFDGPTGVSAAIPTYEVQAENPGPLSAITDPFLIFGGNPQQPTGMQFVASATHLPTAGKFLWVQLINSDLRQWTTTGGSQVQSQLGPGVPGMDSWYPFGYDTDGSLTGNVPSGNQPPNSVALDSPRSSLSQQFGYGEFARSFQATMYLMWAPNQDSRCSPHPSIPGSPIFGANLTYAPGTEMNPPPCVIPVPLGTATWHWSGDAVNTLQQSSTVNASQTPVNYLQWILNCGYPSTPNAADFQFQPVDLGADTTATTLFPAWTSIGGYQ